MLPLLALIASATTLRAHHNVKVPYDVEHPVPLNGTVTAVLWRNPHSFILVDAKDDAGTVVNWKVELLAGLILSREGLPRNALHVGDPINMTVCVARDGSHTAAAQFITIPKAFQNRRAGLCKVPQ